MRPAIISVIALLSLSPAWWWRVAHVGLADRLLHTSRPRGAARQAQLKWPVLRVGLPQKLQRQRDLLGDNGSDLGFEP